MMLYARKDERRDEIIRLMLRAYSHRQLIVLANKCGDEGEAGLGTAGPERVYAECDRGIRLRELDGQQPFRHIKPWYNMIG